MRTEAEIKKAHDILDAICHYNTNLPEEERMPEDFFLKLKLSHDALQWALDLPGNVAFSANLRNLEKVLHDGGFRIVPKDTGGVEVLNE